MTTMTPMTEKRYETTWLRPEYADIPEELIGTVEIAQMAEVLPRTALMWAEKYDDFPAPVKEVKAGRGVTRSYVAREVAHWLLAQRPSIVRHLPEEQRMAAHVALYQAEIAALQGQIDRKRVQRDAMIEALQGDTPRNP